MRVIFLALGVSGVVAFAALAADPEPQPAQPPQSTQPQMPMMSTVPASTVSVEDVDGGERLVFKAKEAKDVAALRAWAREMADHMRQGCPMGHMGHMGSMGSMRGMAMPMMGCPMMAPPGTPAPVPAPKSP